MKVIALEEAKANLELYADECRTSPVVVTIGGKPVFEMLPIHSDDPEFIDRLLEHNSEFVRLMEERRREAASGSATSLQDVRERLGL